MRGSIHATRRFPSGANSRGGKRAASLTAFNVLAGNGYSVLAVAVEDSRAAVTEYAKAAKLTFATALDLNSSVKRAAGDLFIDRHEMKIRDLVIGPVTPERASAALKNAGIRR
jgi:hypothetical protein